MRRSSASRFHMVSLSVVIGGGQSVHIVPEYKSTRINGPLDQLAFIITAVQIILR